jgi:hypothetical protein
MRRVRRICVAACVGVTAIALAGLTSSSTAGAAQNFRGVASADAVRVQVIVPNFPVTSAVVDTGLYSAEAVVTSNNNSQAFASHPYPGEGVVSLPGTLAGFGAGGIPAYPAYASSVYPDRQHSEIGNGPFHLAADSTEKSSESSASSGVSGEQSLGSAVTKVSVKRDDGGGVVAQSASTVTAFAVQAVKIGSVVSGATTKLLADGKLERSSSLDISGLTVNDTAVRLGPGGLSVAGQTVPLDPKPINEALKQAGVSIAYIAPQELPNGIVGAGVKITSAVAVPGSGTINVSWTLGRSLATIDSAAAADDVISDLPADVPPAPPAPVAEAPAPAAIPPSATASGTATNAASGSAALSGSGVTRSGSTTGGYGSTSSAAGGTTAAPTEAAAPASNGTAAAPAPVTTPFRPATTPASSKAVDSSAFYLLLIAGAAGVVVLSQVLSLLGVKVR